MSQNLIFKPAMAQLIFSLNMPGAEILIKTYLPYSDNIKIGLLREVVCSKANTMLAFSQKAYTREGYLEKIPSFILNTAELPSENLTLITFVSA